MKYAIIHGHPIHYKHLLFRELRMGGLDFEVIFGAAQSMVRHEPIRLSSDLYPYRIIYEGQYEAAPRATRALGTWCAISELNPDVVIISGYHSAEGWAAWLWALLHKRKIVMWYESNEFDYPNRPWYKETVKRVFLRGVDQAHVYGTSNKAYLEKLGLAGDRIAIKGAVVNVEAFSTPDDLKTWSGPGVKRLLYIGRLAVEKNVALLLRALASAIKLAGAPLWTLTIVGTGPLEQQLRQLCSSLAIERFVDFVGYCPQSELPQLCRQTDVFILPSTREQWGNVVLEAMLCRLPIAVSTQCGCALDLAKPDTGWVFPPWTDEPLTDILLKLPDLGRTELARMGSECHKLASGYSAASCAERIISSLKQLTPQVERRQSEANAELAL